MLEDLDLSAIPDAVVRAQVERVLNVVEALSAELAAAHRPAPAALSMKERRVKGECGASLPMQTSQYEIRHEDRLTCGPLTWLRKNQPRLPQLQPRGLWFLDFPRLPS